MKSGSILAWNELFRRVLAFLKRRFAVILMQECCLDMPDGYSRVGWARSEAVDCPNLFVQNFFIWKNVTLIVFSFYFIIFVAQSVEKGKWCSATTKSVIAYVLVVENMN